MMTIACIDVGYTETESGETSARAAGVVIDDYTDAVPTAEHVIEIRSVRGYEPGQFYLRELPCLHAVLAKLKDQPEAIVIDGYVWLDGQNTPGLGAHLYESLRQEVPVIGVAKNPFKQTAHATKLYRGGSTRPLFVTAVGIRTAEAADKIAAMHGAHRILSVLKRADWFSRDSE